MRVLRTALASLTLLATWQFVTYQSPAAQAVHPQHLIPRGDLFYNYYADPGVCGTAAAELYISPQPAPPFVGHTYVTYQPLLPHEMLYQHKRTYWSHPWSGGWTRTRVHYW